MKTENKIATVLDYHTTGGVPDLFNANLHQTTKKPLKNNTRKGHHALCSVSLGAQAKFLLQNEVGDIYAPKGRQPSYCRILVTEVVRRRRIELAI